MLRPGMLITSIAAAFIAACGLSVVGTVAVDSVDAGADVGSMDVDAGRREDVVAVDGGLDGVSTTPDADAGCPLVCNDGCNGGQCRILNPSAPIACPPGMSCRVECAEKQRCKNIDCSSSTSCRIECLTGQACDDITLACGAAPCVIVCANQQGCNSVAISASASPSLCLSCEGSDGCNSVSCSGAPATKSCSGNHCNSVSGCGTLAAVPSCP